MEFITYISEKRSTGKQNKTKNNKGGIPKPGHLSGFDNNFLSLEILIIKVRGAACSRGAGASYKKFL